MNQTPFQQNTDCPEGIQLEFAPELLPQFPSADLPPSAEQTFPPSAEQAFPPAAEQDEALRRLQARQQFRQHRRARARAARKISSSGRATFLMAAAIICGLAYLSSRIIMDQPENVANAAAAPVSSVIADDIIIDVVQLDGKSQIVALRNGSYEPIDYEYEYGQFLSGDDFEEYSDWQPPDIVLPEVTEIPEIAEVEVSGETGLAAFSINNGIVVTVPSFEDAHWITEKLFEPYRKPVDADKLRGIGFNKSVEIMTMTEDAPVTSREEAFLLLQQQLVVVTTEEFILEETVPFTTKYIDDASMNKGTQKVIQQGKNGLRKATYVVTYMNGVQDSKKLAAQKALEDMVPQIVNRGTKGVTNSSNSANYTEGKSGPNEGVQGKDKGSLSFDWPYKAKVTSNFGPRWGRYHYGLDITGPRNASLKASESGTVTSYWGTRGDYGLIVEIDHGNGFVTRYAHCEKLLVNPGDRVVKGQAVALMGDSGNANGVHIHFEIRVGGTPYNPRFYLNDGFKY